MSGMTGRPAGHGAWWALAVVVLTLVLAVPSFAALAGDTPPPSDAHRRGPDRLEGVVVLMRHGVRSYVSPVQTLNVWSKEPWPVFDVPDGYLTPRGFRLAALLGAYYREHYQALGLLPVGDCAAAWIHANRVQRTEETGRAMAQALLPGCPAHVDLAPKGKPDPLFDPVGAGATTLNYDLALASVQGRIGDAQPWTAAWAGDTVALQTLLLDCAPVECARQAQAGGPLAGRRLLTEVATVLTKGAGPLPVNLQSPISSGATLTDSLLMAYAQGFPIPQLAGGRFTTALMNQTESLNEANWNIRLRTPYMAQVGATPLLAAILNLLEGQGPAPVSVLVGHDGNVILLAGLLRLDWAMAGYQPDEVPPASGLVFERWRRGADGRTVIRVRFTTQSLGQLRDVSVLSPEDPPLSSPVFVPGCSEAGATMDCPLDTLRHVANAAMRAR